MPETEPLWRQPFKKGWTGDYAHADNEREGVSTNADPYADRGGVLETFRGAVQNLYKVCANWVRRADGRHDEVAYLMFRAIGPRGDEGVVAIGVKGEGEEAVAERVFVGRHQVIILGPVVADAFIGRMTRFYSDHGRLCFNVQDDEGGAGKITAYDTKGTSDESKWEPVGQLAIPLLPGKTGLPPLKP